MIPGPVSGLVSGLVSGVVPSLVAGLATSVICQYAYIAEPRVYQALSRDIEFL